MSNKPNVLVLIDWFYPGYLAGGPIQSVLSLVYELHPYFNFKILTSDHDLDNKPYPGIRTNAWIETDIPVQVYYLSSDNLSATNIKKVIDESGFDIIYFNSLFSKYFSIIPLLIVNRNYKSKPKIFAPRGMLGTGALAIKPLKKKIFIWISRLTGFHRNIVWHATSEEEKTDIIKSYGANISVHIVPNLPKKIMARAERIKNPNELNICFVSRISPKKNLEFCLEVLRLIKKGRINFSIYGPVDDSEYWKKCSMLLNEMPHNILAEYKGSKDPKTIEKVFLTEHLLFLPTLNENFGHAIVESLLSGCPVLISDQTPWNDIEKYNGGFSLPLNDKEKFKHCIEEFLAMNNDEFRKKSIGATDYINKKINVESITEQYKQLFNERSKN
jgi:glycosyltransferase involved in cell wall biosynthesis